MSENKYNSLSKFVHVYEEAWGEKAMSKKELDDAEKNAVNAKDIDPKKVGFVTNGHEGPGASDAVKGKDANSNGSKGRWAYDESTAEDLAKRKELKEQMSENFEALYTRLKGKGLDFLVLGDAGWAKTSLIEAVGKMCGWSIITVYLDKAEPTDLGGIPVPVDDAETKTSYVDYLLPSWANIILQNPDKKFLLFFDEMNQANPQVLNALMPIVLKHVICGAKFDNIVVGAAGNEQKQNASVEDILENKPLRDRFKPIIHWETHTDETWGEAFVYLHSQWDKKIGKAIVDKFQEYAKYWNSPRDIERVIFEYALEAKDEFRESPKAVRSRIDDVIWDELPSSERNGRLFDKDMETITQYLYDWCKNGGKEEDKSGAESRRRAKGGDQVNEGDKEAIITCLKQGYVFNNKSFNPESPDNKKYLCTVENVVRDLINPEKSGVTAEVLQRIVRQMEDAGTPPRYYKNEDGKADAKKNGWLNPENGEEF